MAYLYIQPSREGRVGIIRLHRPEALNALNLAFADELAEELERLDQEDEIRVILLVGEERAFAAGADIDEMAEEKPVSLLLRDQFRVWDRIGRIRKPLIGAVSGYVLGGGHELMMNCDLVVASETARFGQPEINLGIMPGAGGTVRLTKTVGKVAAMEMLLTGEPITARRAYELGLVNRVTPVEVYEQEALKLARRIAEQAPIAVRMIKKSVLKAIDLPLQEGMEYERNAFYLLFDSRDQKEGMRAFVEKRRPAFLGE